MNIEGILNNIASIFKKPSFTFVIGVIFTAFISYIFTFIKEKQSTKEKINFTVSNELNQKIYKCTQFSTTIFINQLTTDFFCFKMSVSTAKNINQIMNKYDNEKIYIAQEELLKRKNLLLGNISNLQQLILDIVLYMESNFIALNKFTEFRAELLSIVQLITIERDKLTHLLYFESNNWEESLDDNDFKIVEKKIKKINSNFEKIKINIITCLYDFQVGIQNEYFSKYFHRNFRKYKLLPRKPLVGKVIIPKKPKNRFLDMFQNK